ncbi:hypothetical protein DM860_017979 [Cuscuta australis]|uniref:Uncharacterized protein n=1 Tax=Cuscuta australis TaxID=267555 RepID=A0A328E0D7_9ASTE|nr:hypothetical protein DM860_017979 [Cuscuta australis]
MVVIKVSSRAWVEKDMSATIHVVDDAFQETMQTVTTLVEDVVDMDDVVLSREGHAMFTGGDDLMEESEDEDDPELSSDEAENVFRLSESSSEEDDDKTN